MKVRIKERGKELWVGGIFITDPRVKQRVLEITDFLTEKEKEITEKEFMKWDKLFKAIQSYPIEVVIEAEEKSLETLKNKGEEIFIDYRVTPEEIKKAISRNIIKEYKEPANNMEFKGVEIEILDDISGHKKYQIHLNELQAMLLLRSYGKNEEPKGEKFTLFKKEVESWIGAFKEINEYNWKEAKEVLENLILEEENASPRDTLIRFREGIIRIKEKRERELLEEIENHKKYKKGIAEILAFGSPEAIEILREKARKKLEENEKRGA